VGSQMLPSLAESVLDSLSVNLALLNQDGVIIYTNSHWKQFGEQHGQTNTKSDEGENYLKACTSADDPFAEKMAEGIRKIIDGSRSSFELEYPCHSDDDHQWFIMRAESCEFGDQMLILVSHYDITRRKLSEIQTKRFTRVVEEIPLGLMVLEYSDENEEFSIQEFNPFAQALTGLQREEVIGELLSDVFPDIRNTKLFPGFLKVYKNEDVFEISAYESTEPEFEEMFWDIKAFPLSQELIGISFEDVTDEVESREKLEYVATHDEMTGLLERSHFLERFSEEFTRARRYERILSMILLDLDDFKKINDTYGHLVGDKVLKTIGRELSDRARDSDLIGRYGGEEFCLVLPETTLKDARELAERIRKTIEELEFSSDDDETFHVTTSIGLTELNEQDDDIRDMIGRADQALYKAKDLGKNLVKEN